MKFMTSKYLLSLSALLVVLTFQQATAKKKKAEQPKTTKTKEATPKEIPVDKNKLKQDLKILNDSIASWEELKKTPAEGHTRAEAEAKLKELKEFKADIEAELAGS